MEAAHLQLRGTLTHGEYHQIVNAAVLAKRHLGLGAGQGALQEGSQATRSVLARTLAIPKVHPEEPPHQRDDCDWRTDDLHPMGVGVHRQRTFMDVCVNFTDYVMWPGATLRRIWVYCRFRQCDELGYTQIHSS
jgi:hypothetical protein